MLEDVDLVLVMSVNPGFGGQKFISSQLKKIEAIANRIAKEHLDVLIEVDGGIDPETARQAVAAGAERARRGHRRLSRRPRFLMRPTFGAEGRRMNAPGSAAERDAVHKLARGSLLSRLKGSRQPLKLVAVPRDHVPGDRSRGEALLAGGLPIGSEVVPIAELDFAALGGSGAVAERFRASPGFEISRRPPRARRAPASPKSVVGRWLLAHGSQASTTPGRRICGASESCSGPPTRPTSCRAPTPATARPCSTRSRAARATSRRPPTRRRPGSSA